jgi:hypothetical protein
MAAVERALVALDAGELESAKLELRSFLAARNL